MRLRRMHTMNLYQEFRHQEHPAHHMRGWVLKDMSFWPSRNYLSNNIIDLRSDYAIATDFNDSIVWPNLTRYRPRTYYTESDDESDCDTASETSEYEVQSGYFMSNLFDKVNSEVWKSGDESLKLIEDLTLFATMMVQSRSKAQYATAVTTLLKLRSNGPIVTTKFLSQILTYFEFLFGDWELQSSDGVLKDLRSLLTSYETVKALPVFTKFYRFSMYCLSLDLFAGQGLTLDKCRYSQVEQEAIRRKFHMGPDFVHCMLDTVLFLTEVGYQCYKTGSLDPIYHSGSKYEEWYTRSSDIIRQSNFLSNPEPHGINRFSFLADLKELIEQGNAISKYAVSDPVMKRIVNCMLDKLKMVESSELTKRAAQKDRRAPFSLLLHGGSSIAKSTLTKVLYYHYGKVMNLPISPEFKYTRNSVDEYWSNFNSTQWCVQLDDIGFLHPNVATNGDPSLMEMLQVINNVPFVPIQAAIEDKGRTPMLSRFVIATTNTEHLNTSYYFSCPLAVLRRLPFVVHVVPKPEFCKDGQMLDGKKVPPIVEGEYPDYWNFTVKRVVPDGRVRDGQGARHEIVNKFEDIYSFLDWFTVEALEFDKIQAKVVDCDDHMAKVKLCQDCYRPSSRCKCSLPSEKDMDIQSGEDWFETPWVKECMNRFSAANETARTMHEETFTLPYSELSMFTFLSSWLVLYLHYFSPKWSACFARIYGRWTAYVQIYNIISTAVVAKQIFRNFGRSVERNIGTNLAIKRTAQIVATGISLYATYRGIMKAWEWMEKPLNPQGKEPDIGKPPDADDEERVNVWYKDDYETTTFDVSVGSQSTVGMQDTEILKIFRGNLISLVVDTGASFGTFFKATCITGHIYLTNNHCIPCVSTPMKFKLVQSTSKDGVTPNTTFMLSEDDLYRVPALDIVFVRIRFVAPKKDIRSFIATPTLRGVHRGFIIGRETDGSLTNRSARCIKYGVLSINNPKLHEPVYNRHVWETTVLNPTKDGDCGALMVSCEPNGAVILGIHALGGGCKAASYAIDIDMVNMAMQHFEPISIQSFVPVLSAPTAKRNLEDLHRKSCIRYVREGSGNVYGSFTGFRARGRSSVVRSVLYSELMQHGYTLKHAPPAMSGWEPYRLALLDMVRPVTEIDTSTLRRVVSEFTHDILSGLSEEQLKQVHVYDYDTAINGYDGVSFVDKMNRNTSAGCPWKKSKKFFMQAAPSRKGHCDPIDFDSEIMNRARECEKGYLEGKRYHPVFCAHLKDEPVTIKKSKEKKTRVFTGAPVDWCIVNRKYLLSVIRLIQNNRFVFESGPGTIAQSLEWEEIYHYLTTFGQNKIIAGDYSKFDKRMSSCLILAAFDIIMAICTKAGYSSEELLVVMGIAEDTAFPLIDFNGDLIEFFGTNPSGHPLTVIINGLVNSLYMRYCYAKLNPHGETAQDFKEKVKLMTYGDDMIAGVCDTAPWFTHTNIQRILASIDVGYTMADKDAESVPYIHIKDATFLKRSWRWDEDIGAYVAPLEHDSIEKMLLINVRSKTISQEYQAICVADTACREYFWYGKKIFNEKRILLKDTIIKLGLDSLLDDSHFPEWQELYDRFWSYKPRA